MDELEGFRKRIDEFDLSVPARFYITSDQDRATLRSFLEGLGLALEPDSPSGDTPHPSPNGKQVSVEVTMLIQSALLRAVAKIAFNYMTHVHGQDFALKEAFDKVRAFVRYGLKPEYRLVLPTTDPILFDDLPKVRQTDGHIVTVNWSPTREHLVGQISLFNTVRYAVSLARFYPGIYSPEFRRGHHFNWRTGEITPLLVVTSSILIPRARLRP
jgi:thioester reductase-like protein